MMTSEHQASEFFKFWSDLMTRAGDFGAASAQPGNGAAPAFNPAARQMQQAFFDVLARQADEFMRSEPFLQMMQRSMEQSLQFKRLMADFLTKAHRSAELPVQADIDDLASLLRGIEERIFERLGRIEERVAAVEESRGGRRTKPASPRPTVAARRRKKKP